MHVGKFFIIQSYMQRAPDSPGKTFAVLQKIENPIVPPQDGQRHSKGKEQQLLHTKLLKYPRKKEKSARGFLLCKTVRHCHKQNPRHNPFCGWKIVLQTLGHSINQSDKRSYPSGMYSANSNAINWITDLHLGM